MPRFLIASFFVLLAAQGAAQTTAATQSYPSGVRSVASENVLAIGGELALEVPGLSEWLATNPGAKLALFVNGHLAAQAPRIGPGVDRVTFDVNWDRDRREPLAKIFGSPSLELREATAEVGPVTGRRFGGELRVRVSTLSGTRMAIAITAALVLLGGFLWLAIRSDVLREGMLPSGESRRLFSLGRTQMAVWFFVVVGSVIFIWAVTDAHQTLSPGVLGLIGISAGTALGACVIDNSKQTSLERAADALNAERLQAYASISSTQAAVARLKQDIAAYPQSPELAQWQDRLVKLEADIASKSERVSQIETQHLADTRAILPPVSKGFMMDLLTDENGVSFHRLQIVVWTVLLIGLFAYMVYTSLAMPDLDAQWLGLMGLSAGTYLGFKFPEVK